MANHVKALLEKAAGVRYALQFRHDSLRAVMIDGVSLAALGVPLAIVAAWGLASFSVALRIFRWR